MFGRQFRRVYRFALALAVMILAAGLASVPGLAASSQYTREAKLKDGSKYPGVYYVKVKKGDSSATLGIPSISKKKLASNPTTESPAIIMGAAVPYETRTGFTTFKKRSGAKLYPPYSYFRYAITEEPNLNGESGTHRKISGFDGSYVIIRVDVSDFIKDAPEGSYLHVKQSGNKALMASLLHEAMTPESGFATFSDATGNKVGVYALANGAISLKDKKGDDKSTPYVDLIVFASGTHVAGADTGSTDPTVISADFTLQLYIDKTADYDPSLVYDPIAASPSDPNAPTMSQKMLAKYFNDKAKGITQYKVMGSDLELEVMAETSGARQFWSLRKALAYDAYNKVPIKLISEVPVLESLVVEGKSGSKRYVIFDVNSFDIQIANHQTTGAAALTIKNATLELKDGFETTGAELAVGNNASMVIQKGGKLIVSEKCQLEVEYDAASTTTGQTASKLDVGVLTIEDGGVIENRGVITVEGTEGKPIDPATPTQRDIKDAKFYIDKGGKLINKGCLLSYGALYNHGTIENYGRYSDTIVSQDPDKGTFTYHRGIQVSWKDDVTQKSTYPGHIYNGGNERGLVNADAKIVNSGDIVMVPGYVENYGIVENNAKANIYLCAVKEAIIPIVATADQPYVMEKRIAFHHPLMSMWINYSESKLTNSGNIAVGDVEIVSNGRTGKLKAVTGGEMFENISLLSYGQMINKGTITLDGVDNFGTLSNEGSGAIADYVILRSEDGQTGTLIDKSKKKLSEVFNGALTKKGSTYTWKYAECTDFTVLPTLQYGKGGKTVDWKVRANTEQPGENIRYMLYVFEANGLNFATDYTINANEDVTLVSPKLPRVNRNEVFTFYLKDARTAIYNRNATVKVTSSPVNIPPAPIPDLVYNGTEQTLTTTGAMNGKMVYRLGTEGKWSEKVPSAKNAGSYEVYYRLKEGAEADALAVTATIAQCPATLSADDQVSALNGELKALSWTVSGLAKGEALKDGDVTVSTKADLTREGVYPITVTLAGDYPNYAFTLKEGAYTVSPAAFDVIARDKYGVYSDEASYAGFNINVTAPKDATVYYSTTTELTDANYSTDGVTALKFLPAGVGTHTVYYYVTNGTFSVHGSKRVIIDKASQAAPKDLATQAESYLNSGDGRISGLTPRAMEYRSIDNDGAYTDIFYDEIVVGPGTYLVRWKGDANHYPSPDAKVTVNKSGAITITFDSNGGSAVKKVTGLACGDLLKSPSKNPTLKNAEFLGWFRNGQKYDFDAPVTTSFTLTAGWKPKAKARVTLPANTKKVGASAFEGDKGITCVEIPYGCTAIGANAFKDCTALTAVVIPASVKTIDPKAFDGCGQLLVFGLNGSDEEGNKVSASEKYCGERDNFTFIPDVGGSVLSNME